MAGRSTAYKLALQEAKAETAQFILTLRGGQKKKTAQLGYRRGAKQDGQQEQPVQQKTANKG
jgi:hypothetical protein